MLENYFSGLYQRVAENSYQLASKEIVKALANGGDCLDCGANNGHWYTKLSKEIDLSIEQYYGIEWNEACVKTSQEKGLNICLGDLNKLLPYKDDKFTCIYALSVLEHLLNGCKFLKECHRTLKDDGKLILLTPNIATFFTVAFLLLGKMPSTGPHPDSDALLNAEWEKLHNLGSCHEAWAFDSESDTPVHRHLIVFSFRVLKRYLEMIGFSKVKGYGFGLYPFPNFMQPMLEKIDPWHCHQMVFIAQK